MEKHKGPSQLRGLFFVLLPRRSTYDPPVDIPVENLFRFIFATR